MTYVELNTDPAYMSQYTAALFLPHTDLCCFRRPKKLVPFPVAPHIHAGLLRGPETAAQPPNHQHQAHAKVIERGAAVLAGIELKSRCGKLGLPAPDGAGSLRVRIFNQDLRFSLPKFEAVVESTGQSAELLDRLLLVRYLLCDLSVTPTGQLISFRELPGGQFHWEPFRKRSLNPLLQRIGNDIDRLRRNLDRFRLAAAGHGRFGGPHPRAGERRRHARLSIGRRGNGSGRRFAF